MNSLPIFLSLFVVSVFGAATRNECLPDCRCIPNEGVIRCDSKQLRMLPLPDSPLPNYKVLALFCNGISYIPSEKQMRHYFPDLETIDLQGNPLKCDSLDYGNLSIINDCRTVPTKCSSKAACDPNDRNCLDNPVWDKFSSTLTKTMKTLGITKLFAMFKEWLVDVEHSAKEMTRTATRPFL